MLASAGSVEKLSAADFVFEVKYDGFRALAGLTDGNVALQSRNGLDFSGRFPAIARAITKLDFRDAVFDGEIVVLDERGISRFERLQQGLADAQFCVFDLLWLNGEDLRGHSLDRRREILERVARSFDLPLTLGERLADTARFALSTARRQGLEGVIAKRRAAPYVGRRSGDWIKEKFQRSQEVVIIGYTPISSGEKAIGALLLAVADGHVGFLFAGKVGTVFDTTQREELWRALESERIEQPERVDSPPSEKEARWVPPRHVAQVGFLEWSRDGRLRHPVFRGLRVDKAPEECVREADDVSG